MGMLITFSIFCWYTKSWRDPRALNINNDNNNDNNGYRNTESTFHARHSAQNFLEYPIILREQYYLAHFRDAGTRSLPF